MENNELKEKIITIREPKNLNPADNKPINFVDENKDRYTLWKIKKDGTEGKAYQYFKQLPYNGEGATVGIVYKEEPHSYTNKEGIAVNTTQRTVVMMKNPSEVKPQNQVPLNPNGTMQPAQFVQDSVKSHPEPTGTPLPQNKIYPTSQPNTPTQANTEPNWDKISWGKCKHAYLVEIFKIYYSNGALTPKGIEEAEAHAEQWADMSMRRISDNKPNDIPVEQSDFRDDEIPHIPF